MISPVPVWLALFCLPTGGPQSGYLETLGVVAATTTVRVPAPAGLPLRQALEQGSAVEEGQPLARFESEPCQQALEIEAHEKEALEAELELARLAIEAAQENLAQLEERRSAHTEKGANEEVAELERDLRVAQRVRRNAELRAQVAEARLAAQRSRFELARWRLEQLRCPAPIHGSIARVFLSPGEIAPGEIGTLSTQPLCEIVQLDHLFIEAELPTRHLASVKPGMRVLVRLLDLPGRTFTGEVTKIASMIAPGKNTFGLRVSFEPGEVHIFPGMRASMRIYTK